MILCFIVSVVWCLLVYVVEFFTFGFNSVGTQVLYCVLLFVLVVLLDFGRWLVWLWCGADCVLLLVWIVVASWLFGLCWLVLAVWCFVHGVALLVCGCVLYNYYLWLVCSRLGWVGDVDCLIVLLCVMVAVCVVLFLSRINWFGLCCLCCLLFV